MTKWDRFKIWFDTTYVPLNFVTLALSVMGFVAFVIKDYYGPAFWVAIALILWSIADIIKWRLKKNASRASS